MDQGFRAILDPYYVLEMTQIKKFTLTPLYDSEEAENKEWPEKDACLTVNFAHTIITVFLMVGFIYCRLPQAYMLQ